MQRPMDKINIQNVSNARHKQDNKLLIVLLHTHVKAKRNFKSKRNIKIILAYSQYQLI